MPTTRFVIEDADHAEWQSEHASLPEAWAELARLSEVPWNEAPNVAPCTGWQKCGRSYAIVEYDASSEPWRLIRKIPVLGVSAAGAVWAPGAAQPA